MGGFVISAARDGIPISSILVTNGAEAVIPHAFLAQHGYHAKLTTPEICRLRGAVRVSEAREEAHRLGLSDGSVILLQKQTWFTEHRTPDNALNSDGSLCDVDRFKHGPLKSESIYEIQELLNNAKGSNILFAVPAPHDRQLMHRITTALVVKALSLLPDIDFKRFKLLIYKCLSTTKWKESENHIAIGFGEEIMSRKCFAINANESMKTRRKIIGGYSNKGRDFYDVIIRSKNSADAQKYKLKEPYAECFQCCNVPSNMWHALKQWAETWDVVD